MKYYYRYPGIQAWIETDKQTYYNVSRRKGSKRTDERYKGVLVARYVELCFPYHHVYY